MTMKSTLKIATVSAITDISLHMRRIVFYSSDFEGWPPGLESAHVKVVIPKPGTTQPVMGKKYMRSYTIRAFDTQNKLLTIDFAINDHVGLIAAWATAANIGDAAGFLGPGPVKHKDFHADWHLLIADFTGLPAVAATIERLSATAQGYAVIQVPSEQDIQPINTPSALELEWVVNPNARKPMLYPRVAAYQWKTGEPAIFIATEDSQMKQLLALIQKRPAYNSHKLYASGYWKA